MPPARRKAPRQQAPTNIEEATGLLGKYAGIITAAEQLRADADAAIAAIEAARDQALAPIEEEAKAIFAQLRPWWAVAGEMLTEGKRKSIELAGCLIGVRTTPPSLKMPKGKAEEAALALLNAGLANFCRHKVEVDKPAVLALLASEEMLDTLRDTAANDAARELVEEIALRIETVIELGFRRVQKEEFFIDRAAKAPADPEQVQLQEAAE